MNLYKTPKNNDSIIIVVNSLRNPLFVLADPLKCFSTIYIKPKDNIVATPVYKTTDEEDPNEDDEEEEDPFVDDDAFENNDTNWGSMQQHNRTMKIPTNKKFSGPPY